MVLLAVFQYALDTIDSVIIKLWVINKRQEYLDWVANLSTALPSTLFSSLHFSFSSAFLLNNKMRRLIIDCDLSSN